ncbi:hypothetical protein C0991_006162, partial [Blastosporella zonata]
ASTPPVWKEATVPPKDDLTTSYFESEEDVDYEVRAGLTSTYTEKGWVADDVHSESASRTLDYAYNDYSAYKLAAALGLTRILASWKPGMRTAVGRERIMDGQKVRSSLSTYPALLGVCVMDDMAPPGDKWAYSFDVVHNIAALIEKRYIFSAMGFYPVNPVSGEYIVGSYVSPPITTTIWLIARLCL